MAWRSGGTWGFETFLGLGSPNAARDGLEDLVDVHFSLRFKLGWRDAAPQEAVIPVLDHEF